MGMNEIRKEWLRRLRSGEIVQGHLFLRPVSIHDSRCCLGVLCDIVDPDDWYLDINDLNNLNTWSHRGDDTTPDETVLEEVGITQEFAEFLAALNDGGRTFAQIADVIEYSDFGKSHEIVGCRETNFEQRSLRC